MLHRFYCLAQHHRESTHTSYLDQILKEQIPADFAKQALHNRRGFRRCQSFYER